MPGGYVDRVRHAVAEVLVAADVIDPYDDGLRVTCEALRLAVADGAGVDGVADLLDEHRIGLADDPYTREVARRVIDAVRGKQRCWT